MDLVRILGRRAVPVRLIQYAAPSLGSDELALILARQHPTCRWNLKAHRLRANGTVVEIHADEWHRIVRELGSLAGQTDVHTRAIKTLPPGAFVWHDELGAEYWKFSSEDVIDWVDYDGGRFMSAEKGAGDLSFDRVPPAQPELIYEDFESLMKPAPGPFLSDGHTNAVADLAAEGPSPLTTSDVAFCFAGLRWTDTQWKKPLGNKPKWLRSCIATPGRRGINETRWNPVLIGGALVFKEHAQPRSVRAKFQTKHLLEPWLEVWKTYEADNFDDK